MTDKYTLLMYYVHSNLELVRNHLEIDKGTTVENFQDSETNRAWCMRIFESSLKDYNYELSHNQVCNGINLFLKSNTEWLKSNA